MISKLIIYAISAFGGTFGFSILINAPKRMVLPAAVTSFFGYGLSTVLLLMADFSEMTAYFFASVFMAVLCEIEARVMRMPSTIFLLSALVPLVPGYTIYRAMLFLVENNGARAAATALSALQGVAAIAVGAVTASVCFRALSSRRMRREKNLK